MTNDPLIMIGLTVFGIIVVGPILYTVIIWLAARDSERGREQARRRRARRY